MKIKHFQSHYLQQIRQQNPLVHNITNVVAANFSANGLLALGASPLMAACPKEVAQAVAISQALVINIGTLFGKELDSLLLAGRTANALGVPVLLDPVGVGAIPVRLQLVKKLLAEIQFSAIRGNAGELAAIANMQWQAKGVDAGSGKADLGEIVHKIAQQYACVAVLSGEVDWLSNGEQTVQLHNGTPLLPKITASGCLLSAICGAFLAVAQGNKEAQKTQGFLPALIEACSYYAIAGELAAQNLRPTQVGQFQIQLLDQLAEIQPEQLEQLAKIYYGEVAYAK